MSKTRKQPGGKRPTQETPSGGPRNSGSRGGRRGSSKNWSDSPERETSAGRRSERSADRGQQRTAEKRGERATARHQSNPETMPTEAIRPSARRGFFIYGRNSVEAALKNSKRECLRLIGTEKALSDKTLVNIRPNLKTEVAPDALMIAASVPDGAPHQSILVEVLPLPSLHLEQLAPIDGEKNIILMLDQVTDPHNVGACMRSAAAFGARALITQDRHSPSETGTLARSAAGGLEALPWLQVSNLSGALDKLRGMGYWHIGLDGTTKMALDDVSLGDNIVIVMGSEGKGLRPLVKKNCDVVAKIPMTGEIESLNVSNAAAIALYQLARP